MDDIFGERPEMEAPATYDSTDLANRYRGDRPTQAESSPSTSADMSNTSPPSAMHVDNDNSEAEKGRVVSNKPKRKELPFWFKEMFKKFDEKEKNHERRHRERMEMQQQLLDHLKKRQ